MRSKKLFTVFLALTGMFLFAVPSVYASFDDVSAPTAYAALQSNPAAVIFDTRSVDEHNGYNVPWGSTKGSIDTTADKGTPKWRVNGKTKLPISVPLWVTSSASDPNPQYPTEVRNIIEGLLKRGVIDFNSPIYFLCRTAYRSHEMAQWVDARTFTNVTTGITAAFTNLHDIDADGIYNNGAGGMQEWDADNLPKYMGTDWSGFTYTPPQVFATYDGGSTFTVSVLEPTSSSLFTEPAVSRVSLQIFDPAGDKGSEVAFSTTDASGLWTDYTFDNSVSPYFDIPKSYTWRAYAVNSAGRGLANNALGVTDISPTKAQADAALRKGIVVDVRTWAEHQGCADTGWTPFKYACASTAPNARSPIWTDTATGVVREAINVPFWISDGNNTTGWLPDDATSFTNSFLDLKKAGVIDFNTRLYVMCKSGYRSYWASVYLEKLGFRNVYNIDYANTYNSGGMLEWYADTPLATNTDYHGPQVYAISPDDGYANAATGTFKVGILQVPRAQGKYQPCVTNVDLYVDNFTTPVSTSNVDPADGVLWTEYSFSNTPSAGSHTWNVRAQSGWGNVAPYTTCTGAVPTYTSWNDHADANGPGDRTLDVSTQIAVTDDAGTADDLELNFGNSATTSQVITVTNNDSVSALTGLSTSLATKGAVSFLPFSITNNCGSSLGASANCTIDIGFSPSKAGSFGKVLRINSNDATVPQVKVAMCGTGGGTAPRWTSAVTTDPTVSDNELLSLLSDCSVPAAIGTAAPSVPALLSPADEAENVPTDLTFTWNTSTDADGDAVSYQVCYAPVSEGEAALEGSNCHSVGDVAKGSSSTLYAGLGSGAGLLFFGMVLAGSARRRKIALLIALMAITAMFLVSCGKNTTDTSSNGTNPSAVSGIKTYPATLDANTIYNWKVIATDGQNSTESKTTSFTTGD